MFVRERVEPLPQQAQQRDRRELTDAFTVAGQPGRDRLGRPARQRDPEADRADRDAVLLGRAGDARDGDADVGAEHALRAFRHLARGLLAHDRLGA